MAAARRRWADMIDTEDETEGAEDDSQLRKDVAAFVDEFMGPSAGSRLLTLALLQADLQRRCVGWTFPCRGWRWCVYEAPLTLLAEISVFVSLVGQTRPSERACNRRFRKMLSRWQSRLRLAALDCQHVWPLWLDVIFGSDQSRIRPRVVVRLDLSIYAARVEKRMIERGMRLRDYLNWKPFRVLSPPIPPCAELFES